jgi:hypothetical protein
MISDDIGSSQIFSPLAEDVEIAVLEQWFWAQKVNIALYRAFVMWPLKVWKIC